MTLFTGRNARKGAVYDRTENERNAADHWFGCPNLIYTRERIHLAAMLATDAEMKKNLYRVCRFLAREEIAYRYPIMYEMIRKMFSPDDTNPPEACAMFMPDDETDDEEYAMAA